MELNRIIKFNREKVVKQWEGKQWSWSVTEGIIQAKGGQGLERRCWWQHRVVCLVTNFKEFCNIQAFTFKTATCIECLLVNTGFSGGSMVKNLSASAGDPRNWGSISGSGRSPRGGNGNPLQYSCLENPTDRGAWWATVHGVAKSQTQLSNWTCTHI